MSGSDETWNRVGAFPGTSSRAIFSRRCAAFLANLVNGGRLNAARLSLPIWARPILILLQVCR